MDGRRLPAPGRVQGPRDRQGSPEGRARARHFDQDGDGRRRSANWRLRSCAARRRRSRSPSGKSGRPARAPASTDPAHEPTADELAALEALSKEGQVGDRRPPDQADQPRQGAVSRRPGGGPYTKRDLIRYYVTVAPVLLPYLRDRAVNLWRWPDGVTGNSFWQKQIPALRARLDRALGLIRRPAPASRTPTSSRTASRRWPGWPTTQPSTCIPWTSTIRRLPPPHATRSSTSTRARRRPGTTS